MLCKDWRAHAHVDVSARRSAVVVSSCEFEFAWPPGGRQQKEDRSAADHQALRPSIWDRLELWNITHSTVYDTHTHIRHTLREEGSDYGCVYLQEYDDNKRITIQGQRYDTSQHTAISWVEPTAGIFAYQYSIVESLIHQCADQWYWSFLLHVFPNVFGVALSCSVALSAKVKQGGWQKGKNWGIMKRSHGRVKRDGAEMWGILQNEMIKNLLK